MRLFVTVLVLVGVVAAPPLAAAKPLAVGQKAPDFVLRDQAQALVRFGQVARGQVAVLDFFRTDCKPCRKSLPALTKLQQQFRGKKVKVMLIALLEEDEGERKVEAFFKKNRVAFPVLLDAYGSVAKKYIAKGRSVQLPSLFVIDSRGVVRIRHDSAVSDTKELAAQIAKLL